jgi:hypothetical protein
MSNFNLQMSLWFNKTMQPNGPYAPVPPQTPSPQPPAPSQHPNQYDFIMNPAPPPRRRLLPTGGSLIQKVAIYGGVLLVVLIALGVVKNMITASHVSPYLLSVAQDQQELIHLSTNASAESSLTNAHKNFAISAKLGLTSEQGQLLTYMKKNGKKVKGKTLNLSISTATDITLKSAATTGDYDRQFTEIMEQKLMVYQSHLVMAKSQTSGPKGRLLLNNQQNSAKLLQQMLESK